MGKIAYYAVLVFCLLISLLLLAIGLGLFGCARNIKVNLPKASPEAAETAQKVADYVVENGEKDSDCKRTEKCYSFAKNDSFGNNFFQISTALELKTKQHKVLKKKKTLYINIGIEIEDYEYSFKSRTQIDFADKGMDGKLERMEAIVAENNGTLYAVQYNKGEVEVSGPHAELVREQVTPKWVQKYYEQILIAILRDLKAGK